MTLFSPDSPLVARLHPSPNFEARCGGVRPSLLILHYTGMMSAEGAIDWLSRPESKVSCHYVIDEAGGITQMVAEDRRAWHAGASFWAGETDINSHSIGIEIQNPGHDLGYHDFPPDQMRAVAALARDILKRNDIRPSGVLAHSDIAPGRKIDPGEKFDWAGLAALGVGHWVAPADFDDGDAGFGVGDSHPLIESARALLGHYGYGLGGEGPMDERTSVVIGTFQRHFRPARVDGRLDRSTLRTLERLVAALARSEPRSGGGLA